jgi:DnaJ-class molecular chaperone
MPDQRLRRSVRSLDVAHDASDADQRRWRELAREHHPTRGGQWREAACLTARMARINAAYDALRDPAPRA